MKRALFFGTLVLSIVLISSCDESEEYEICTLERDSGDDGTVDSIYIQTIDSDGNIVKEEYDDEADGTFDSISYYEYNANGDPLEWEYDGEADGEVNAIYIYTYDENGYLMKIEMDAGLDGTSDLIQTYSYNSDYTEMIVESDGYPEEPDGIIDGIYTCTLDGEGKELRCDNGSGDYVLYTYDGNGNLVVYEGYNEQNVLLSIITYEYDDNNNLIKMVDDTDADGELDYVYSYSNDCW